MADGWFDAIIGLGSIKNKFKSHIFGFIVWQIAFNGISKFMRQLIEHLIKYEVKIEKFRFIICHIVHFCFLF